MPPLSVQFLCHPLFSERSDTFGLRQGSDASFALFPDRVVDRILRHCASQLFANKLLTTIESLGRQNRVSANRPHWLQGVRINTIVLSELYFLLGPLCRFYTDVGTGGH